MSARVSGLTEKEKQTLRLLLGGHDAKSIARLLGLSVHTIHERLREARRKLGTASSREAARLLHDLEQRDTASSGTPQSPGDKALGDAADDDQAQPVRQPAEGRGEWRPAGWLAGGLALTIILALLALTAVSDQGRAPAAPPVPPAAPASPAPPAPHALPAPPAVPSAPVAPPPPVARTTAAEAAAVSSAQQFLAVLDRDDWRASWQATHRSFKLQNTVEWWADASRKVRAEAGVPLSRELATVDFAAAPPAGYWIVTFKARYSKKGAATETLQLASEDGGWKIAGITVE